MRIEKRHVAYALAALVVIAGLIAAFKLLPLADWAEALERWISSMGPWSYIGFVLIYIVATVAVLPVAILTIVAGLAFGLWMGFLVVMAGSLFGALAAFVLGRYFFREKVERLLRKHPKVRSLDREIGRKGWRSVALVRLSPMIPFGIQNYLFGVSDVGFWAYAIATFLAMAPGTLLHVYLGMLGRAFLEGELNPWQWAIYGVSMIATVVLTVKIGRILNHGVDESPAAR